MNSVPPNGSPRSVGERPPFVLALLVCSLGVAATIALRLYLYSDRYIPLAYGLPLLLCLWTRDLRLLYGMGVAFSAIVVGKVFWILYPTSQVHDYTYVAAGMQLANIWVVAGVIHAVLYARGRLELKNVLLEQTNSELEAANEELAAGNEALAAREQEITSQNEELQAQSEELERQAEELRRQAEQLELQGRDLQQLNGELVRRQRGLQTLLESGRWLRSDLDEQLVMNAICQAAVQVIGDDVQAAAVVQNGDAGLCLRGHWGFGLSGAVVRTFSFERSFAALVLERGQTAYLEDVQLRDDVELPQPVAGRPFRSILATPIWVEGRAVAAIEAYSHAPRHWTQEQFHVIEWLAAQCGLALQAIRFQQELELKRRDAEEASVQKTRFLAAVSHDVRTPANAISLLADLIDQTAARSGNAHGIADMARDLRNNARSLIELVSDVLDLARFDTGKLDLQVTEFSLNALVQAECKQAMPIAHDKGLRLLATVPEVEIWLRSDRLKLARVLSNLIGNAVKFTHGGEVEISVNPRGPGVDLRVRDTGVGIPAEHLPRIFDEFFQLRNPERDRSKGTGLGLAICRRLVEGLGCTVSVTSVAGVGSTFTVHIPAELLVLPGQTAARGASDGGAASLPDDGDKDALAGLRVLLVEDHDVTRRAVAQLLAAHGAVVSQARTGREALHLLNLGPHEVMLLDLMLPDIDGSDVLRSVQVQRPRELKCILAVSGDVRAARVEEVKQLGADDLIPKPLSIEHLVGALRGLRPPHAPPPPRSSLELEQQD